MSRTKGEQPACWLAGILAAFLASGVTIAGPASSDGPRSAIAGIDGCDFVARENDQQFRYGYACAAALEHFRDLRLLKQCSNVSAVSEKPLPGNLHDLVLALNRGMGDVSAMPSFHPIRRGGFLLELPCNQGAYNTSSVFFAYDESRLPATLRLLKFPRPNGPPQIEVGSRAVDNQRALVIEYTKSRGVGDAGFYARYAIDRMSLRPVLVEAISKDDWDSQDEFQWNGDIDSKPRGPTWHRLYP
jgi:hypothetical protein